MKNQNEEIKQYLEDNGYEIYRYDDNCVEGIVNGVKVEWRSDRKCLVVGAGNNDSDRKQLRQLVVESFGEKAIISRGNSYISFCTNPSFEDYQKIIDVVENIAFIIEKQMGASRGKVALNKDGAFLKMAKMIKFQMELEFGQPDRSSCKMDAVDDIITIGESINRTSENSYREHIVPCDVINREAVEMFRDGKGLTEVASMIQSNLKIVLITNEEAKILDFDLGLKTSMPEGWKIGDDVFARLKAANILLK